MNTTEIENKIEQFRQFLVSVVMHRENLVLNAPDPETANIYGALYILAKCIEREFDGIFSTEPTTDERT